MRKSFTVHKPNLTQKGTEPENQWEMVANKSDGKNSQKKSSDNQLLTTERQLGDNLGQTNFLASLQ
jgi:hypothetical protein